MPPAVEDNTAKILSACDYVFVPIELGTFAVQGVVKVTELISRLPVSFGGCFAVKFDVENPSDHSMLQVLKDGLGAKVMRSVIPFSRVIKNSISYRMTAGEYMEWTTAAERYKELTDEIVKICG